MILTGPSGPSDDDANRRNLNLWNTFFPHSFLRPSSHAIELQGPLRRYGQRGVVMRCGRNLNMNTFVWTLPRSGPASMSCAASYVTARCRCAPSINDAPLALWRWATVCKFPIPHSAIRIRRASLPWHHRSTPSGRRACLCADRPWIGVAYGPFGQTLTTTPFQCRAFRCAKALHWNTITSFAAVEHKSLRQHRYGGVGKHGFYRPGSINELRPICFPPLIKRDELWADPQVT